MMLRGTQQQCDQILRIKIVAFSKVVKNSHRRVSLKLTFFKMAQKLDKLLGYFFKQILPPGAFKIAQSGHSAQQVEGGKPQRHRFLHSIKSQISFKDIKIYYRLNQPSFFLSGEMNPQVVVNIPLVQCDQNLSKYLTQLAKQQTPLCKFSLLQIAKYVVLNKLSSHLDTLQSRH